MFEDSLIESGNRFKTKRGLGITILSFVLQALLVCVLILIPLIYTDALPKGQMMTFLVAPPPPPPPPPPPAAAAVKVVKMVSEVVNGQLRAPTKIPDKVQMIKEEEAPPDLGAGGVPGGVPGGIPGGSAGGVIGGIISSTPVAVPKVATPQRVRVSTGVVDGSFDQESYAKLPATGETGPHSGHGRSAGGNQQGWHDSESAVDQRAPDAGAGGDRGREAVALQALSAQWRAGGRGDTVECELQLVWRLDSPDRLALIFVAVCSPPRPTFSETGSRGEPYPEGHSAYLVSCIIRMSSRELC